MCRYCKHYWRKGVRQDEEYSTAYKYFTNTSRGELVNQKALAEALENGIIYGAALDTIYPEPAPGEHPLLNLSIDTSAKLIITPHIAGKTDEAFTRMLKWAISNMQLIVKGKVPGNVVNGIGIKKGEF